MTATGRRTRRRVAVVGGGRSGEHDVSLASAASIAAALDPDRYDVVRLTIDRDGTWRDAGLRPLGLGGAVCVLRSCDVVVPALHGPHGEDGTLAALCDLAALPCVGSPLAAGALAMDKHVTKLVAGSVGVATAPGRLVTRPEADHVNPSSLSLPVVVKPVAAGSSLGVTLVTRSSDLGPALDAALALDDRVLIEDAVVGREVDLAVLATAPGEHLVAAPLEIVVDGLFDHADKYGDGTAAFVVPAPLEEADHKALVDAATRVYDALGCRGVARVDFFLTDAGPVLNEVNTMPGFTAHSQVPRMFASSGVGYAELLDLMIDDALTRDRD